MVSACYLKQQVANDGEIVSEYSMVQRSTASLSITLVDVGVAERRQQLDTTQVTATHCQLQSSESFHRHTSAAAYSNIML